MDDGDTPITSYIVEYKHPVFNRILISETVNGYREHLNCKLQASGYPREVHVDVRAINKVGRGSRSPVVPVSFFSEFVCCCYFVLIKKIFSYCNSLRAGSRWSTDRARRSRECKIEPRSWHLSPDSFLPDRFPSPLAHVTQM